MPSVARITRRVIDSLPPSVSGKRHYYVMEVGGRDSLVGFGLLVRRTVIEYVVRYRRKPYLIGRAELMPLEEAREAAKTLLIQLRGAPGQVAGQAALAGRTKTVADLARIYLDQVATPRNKPRTLEEYRRLWRLHLLPRFGHLRLSAVTPEKVLELKHDLAATPVAANRALQQLAAAFAFAIKMEWLTKNPAAEGTIDRFTEAPETRALAPEEYVLLGRALDEAESHAILPPRTVAAIRLLLLTGARPHEILAAELSWVKLKPPQRIELPTAKGDRPGRKPRGRAIWLGPAAVRVIQSIQRPPGCRWLIPGDGPETHLGEIKKAWSRVCKLAGIEGATPKSARHSYRSAGPEAGVASEHMRELMGHATSKMTDEVYWHVNSKAQEQAAGVMDGHLERLLTGGGGAADAVDGEAPSR